jgi:hypothetical protein
VAGGVISGEWRGFGDARGDVALCELPSFPLAEERVDQRSVVGVSPRRQARKLLTKLTINKIANYPTSVLLDDYGVQCISISDRSK